tara:strand:- start:873 stop:1145 length:273 start_codon:yes stop_codon:yes gene_type:complete
MSQSRFSEGFILGAFVGVLATYFLSDKVKQVQDKLGDHSDQDDFSPEQKASKVASTRDSIEKGLDNLTQMVEKRKNSQDKSNSKTKTKTV